MAEEAVEHCIMEVSSHALDQRRTHGLHFELGIFTQLTQDHLDYHRTMRQYFEAKRKLFDSHPRPRKMLINADCSYGRKLLHDYPSASSFGINEPAEFRAVDIEPSFQGCRFKLQHKGKTSPFQIRLPMRHNISNVLGVLAALELLGYCPSDFRGSLLEIPGIPGRMERIANAHALEIFVDYAHTPDAIENVLSEARKLSPKRILTLFGCGGDRDASKRPLMGKAAYQYSDLMILTSDNPRSEDPEAILRDIKTGLPHGKNLEKKVFEILNRAEAIEKLIALSEPGDVLFVLGKGHEDYQILGERKIPFDDRLVIQDCLKRKNRVFSS